VKDTPQAPERAGHSRRHFLRSAGVTAAGAVAVAGGCPMGFGGGTAQAAEVTATRADRFGRMLPLPQFAPENDRTVAALKELGKAGGILDANDDLSRGPVDLITDPALSAGNPNNPTHTAGTTFVGQFLDHDITFDATSKLGQATPAEKTVNNRSAAFDLDSVYGAGPGVDPFLYEPDDGAKLLVGYGGRFEDLPRSQNGTALIGDPRNDENLIISGLQAAYLKFHNAAVDHVRTETPGADAFAEAQRLTRWHHQWLVLHQFLPQFVGQEMVDDILQRGRKIYRPSGEAYIPVEFQGAAYRFGHSMVRPSYRANLTGNPGKKPFFGLIFDPNQDGSSDPDDLRGGHRAKRRFIDWGTFFDFGDGDVKPNKLVDTKISSPLMKLPVPVLPGHSGPSSLAQRNLLRHLTWQLPSGQAIAQVLRTDPLSADDLDELRPLGAGFERSTPLWYYVLKEAEVVENGLHLGPVGGRIVAEVFIGLLQLDENSFLATDPGWTPTLGRGSRFDMTDFLKFAGVDPESRRRAG
jgi:hypothetical protein